MTHALPPLLLCAALLLVSPFGVAAPDAVVGVPLLAQAEKREADNGRQRAAERAAAMTGGKVLAAEPATVDDRPVYRVKVLTPDGRVSVVVIEDDGR
ncbi:MAG: hypothetical protein R3298_11395 [Gammaproteobacteria bacterium]|nr:hypothetical protein [Gammaproteobacteria bacterium]